MTGEELEHLLPAAARITGERDVVVLGSQSILGSVPYEALPELAVGSLEADFAFFDDQDNAKSVPPEQ